MITGPEEGAAAGRGSLRASHTDREHVIDTLKAAFVDGRLDSGELDDRVGKTLAARTYAELAAVTADIPAGPAPAPARVPPPLPAVRPSVNKEMVKWGLVAGGSMIPPAMFVAGAFGVWQLALVSFPLLVIELFAAIIIVAVTLTNQRRDRSRGQLPAQPGRVAQSGRHIGAGRQPLPHPTRTEPRGADLPVRKPRQGRPRRGGQAIPVSRGAGLAPGAA